MENVEMFMNDILYVTLHELIGVDSKRWDLGRNEAVRRSTVWLAHVEARVGNNTYDNREMGGVYRQNFYANTHERTLKFGMEQISRNIGRLVEY